MKKTMWAAIALVAVVAMIPLTAQGTQGPGRMGRGFGGPGVRGQGPGGPGPMAMLQQLNLTEQQREQVKALMDERRDQRPGANMQELQKELHAAVFADTVDLAKIEQLKGAIASAEAAMLSARIDTHVKISQILTAEQRAKARELPARGPGRGRRGGI
jgi:Spy/CpxP family protein refolding chaperone